MTVEDRDRLSILIRDAHIALEEAWQLCIRTGDRENAHRLLFADVKVVGVNDTLDLHSVQV